MPSNPSGKRPSSLSTTQNKTATLSLVPAGRGARVGGETPGECSALSQARRVEPVLRLLPPAVGLFWIPSSLRASSRRLLQAASACSVPDSHCPLHSLLPSASPYTLTRDSYRHCHVRKVPPPPPKSKDPGFPFPTENCSAITRPSGVSDLLDRALCLLLGVGITAHSFFLGHVWPIPYTRGQAASRPSHATSLGLQAWQLTLPVSPPPLFILNLVPLGTG